MTAGFKAHVGGEAHGYPTTGHTDSCKISIPLLLTVPLAARLMRFSHPVIVHKMRERDSDSNRANDSILSRIKMRCEHFLDNILHFILKV